MWEAFEHAAYYELDNLDRDHRRQPARPARRDHARLGPQRRTRARAEAFGWHAIEIDGHDFEEIDRAYSRGAAHARPPDGDRRAHAQGQGRQGGREQERLARQGARPIPTRRSRSSAAIGTSRSRCTSPSRPAEPHRFEPCTARWSCRPTRSAARTSPPAPPTARRCGRSATCAATSWRVDGEVVELDLRRVLPRRASRTATSRCTSPSSRWSPRRSACRCASGTRSRRRSRRSSPARTTSSAWRRSAAPTSACAAPTPASRSARTARRRWRSRTWRCCARSTGSTVLYPSDAEPDREAGRADGRPAGDLVHADDARRRRRSSTAPDEEFPIGGSRVVRSSDDDDVTIVAAGITLHEALDGRRLAGRGGHQRPRDRPLLGQAGRRRRRCAPRPKRRTAASSRSRTTGPRAGSARPCWRRSPKSARSRRWSSWRLPSCPAPASRPSCWPPRASTPSTSRMRPSAW